MTDSGPVRLAVDSGIARLELNRPDAANTIDLDMAVALEGAVAALVAQGDAVRAVLLTGAGARFCGGGDVGAFARQDPAALPDLLADITAHLHPAVEQLVGLDAPVVAAVQGSAAGAGLGLVLAADLVVATRSAKFVMAYTGIGLSPDGSSSWFLPRIVGLRRAVELTLTNRVLTANEALEWGIVTTVVDDGELAGAADALVARLAAGPTRAYGRAVRLLRAAGDASLADHLEAERRELAASGATVDGAEGIAAFAAKRPPDFTGT
ncbi:MAG: 2-(1,2-epoxy,2-dihydrophenyl)acetyl-CoA isomerase [Actinomycetota bacterium]